MDDSKRPEKVWSKCRGLAGCGWKSCRSRETCELEVSMRELGTMGKDSITNRKRMIKETSICKKIITRQASPVLGTQHILTYEIQ